MPFPRARLVSSLSLFLCLVLLGLPRVGLAAGDVPRLELPRLALSGPLAGLEDSPGPVPSSSVTFHRPHWGLRLLAEVGLGVVNSVAGSVLGGIVGFGLCKVTGLGEGDSQCLGPLFSGWVVGLIEGYGLGVWKGGGLMKGHGSLAVTLLSASVGALMGTALAVLGVVPFGGMNALVLTVLLSHVGYELSQRAEPSSGQASRPSFQPLLGFSSRGALLGLGGRF